MDSSVFNFSERPGAGPHHGDTPVPQKSPGHLAKCLKTILSDEPLLEETKIRLQNALNVALLLEQEVHQGAVRKATSCPVRGFIVQVSELASDVVNAERKFRARNGIS